MPEKEQAISLAESFEKRMGKSRNRCKFTMIVALTFKLDVCLIILLNSVTQFGLLGISALFKFYFDWLQFIDKDREIGNGIAWAFPICILLFLFPFVDHQR